MASTPAMNVVLTAPSPGIRTPSFPDGDSIFTPFCTTSTSWGVILNDKWQLNIEHWQFFERNVHCSTFNCHFRSRYSHPVQHLHVPPSLLSDNPDSFAR